MVNARLKTDTLQQLADAGREFYRRGWVLGTSGNFSALMAREPLRIWITASGIEKGDLYEKSFLELDENSEVVRQIRLVRPLAKYGRRGSGKPSAETQLHQTLYRSRPDANSVMHTHSVWGTLVSDSFFDRGAVEIEGYEMLKGLSGVATHEHKEIVPIIENSQDYAALSQTVEDVVRRNMNIHGLYLRRHGLYTWGKDIAEAKRHIEIFEFLFEVLGRSLRTA